jgi:SAM-dependent methyltransferase
MSIEFYQQNADEFFIGTVNVDMSNIYQHFTKSLPANALILDAGCGSGRDTKAFLSMGYKVEAFDASSEMVTRACMHTGIDVKLGCFANVTDVNKYDAIWCCASLLHMPENELPEVLNKLATALKPVGIWYTSFKYGDSQREKDGRLFTDVNEDRLAALVHLLPDITVRLTWITVDNRPDRNEQWLNAILVKSTG